MDMGDFARKMHKNQSPEQRKNKIFFTGYPCHHRQVSVSKMRQDSPEFIITNAVKGMLPHNKLGRKF